MTASLVVSRTWLILSPQLQEEGRAGEGNEGSGGLQRRMPRRSVVRSLSTMHMMGFTPLGFFETVSEGENLVEGHMALPTGSHDQLLIATGI